MERRAEDTVKLFSPLISMSGSVEATKSPAAMASTPASSPLISMSGSVEA